MIKSTFVVQKSYLTNKNNLSFSGYLQLDKNGWLSLAKIQRYFWHKLTWQVIYVETMTGFRNFVNFLSSFGVCCYSSYPVLREDIVWNTFRLPVDLHRMWIASQLEDVLVLSPRGICKEICQMMNFFGCSCLSEKSRLSILFSIIITSLQTLLVKKWGVEMILVDKTRRFNAAEVRFHKRKWYLEYINSHWLFENRGFGFKLMEFSAGEGIKHDMFMQMNFIPCKQLHNTCVIVNHSWFQNAVCNIDGFARILDHGKLLLHWTNAL